MRFRLLLCLAALVTAPAFAQEDDAPPAKDAQAVYVRDSGVAAERLTLAAKLERQKEWGKAADVYQEVVTKYADRVIASKNDDAGEPTQYVSAAVVVQDKLSKWPAEGLAAYRRRYEDTARDLLTNSPDDPAVAQRVMTLYYVTDAGRDAALQSLAAAFERGDFAGAAYVGGRLLDTHPGLVAGRPRVLFQTALAEHLSGDDAGAAKRADELKARFAGATASLAGVDTPLGESLAQELSQKPAVARSFTGDDWPVPFGASDADAVPERVSRGGAKLFSVELPVSAPRGVNAQAWRNYQPSLNLARAAGAMTGVMPAVDGGDLFFQDSARVYGISLASGLPLPGWAAAYPGDKHGAYAASDALPVPRGRQLTVNVVAGHVVALLGQNDSVAANSLGYGQQPPSIVCLDRSTGRRQWSANLQTLKLPDTLGNLRDGVFYGSPVVTGDTVYALVHANRGGQFDECYVLALKLDDGTFRWANYVASASLGGRFMDWDPSGDFGSSVTAQLSLSGDRLYVLTNLGALACLDVADGKVVWLDIYPHTPGAAANLRRREFVRPPLLGSKPFAIDPPIVTGGRVFVLPSDANDLLVYDAAGGDLLKRVPRQLEPGRGDSAGGPVDMLLAVTGDSVVLASPARIYRVPWKTFDPAKSLIDNDCRYRSIAPAEGRTGGPPDALRGRPFVSSKYVLVPTADRLYRLTLDSFKIESTYPPQGRWDADESPGNVLATPDNLIVAGPGRVTAYADLSLATAKLDARLAADPKDVDARLRYAELLLAAGDASGGIARLDQAVGALGGAANLTPGPARARLFDIAAGFAVKLQTNEAAKDAVPQLFDRAAYIADTAQQQVTYRLSRAAYFRKTQDVDAEIALHQQVLANAEWRGSTVSGRGGASTAGVEAEQAVADLIRQNGDHVYAAYEALAAERTQSLEQADPVDPDALLAVADEFPASKQTTDVLSVVADRYEADRQPRRATQTLRRLLQRDLSNERRLVVLQGLARNYLAVPNQVDTALVRLRQARELAPSGRLVRAITLPGGRAVADTTLADAVRQLGAFRAEAARRSLPKFDVPVTSAGGDPSKPALRPATDVAGAISLVDQQADAVRNDRVVVYGVDKKISIVAVDSARIIPTDLVMADPPLGGGFAGDTLVVVGPTETAAFDAGGKTLWRSAVAALPVVDAVPAAAVEKTADAQDDNAQQIIIDQRFNGIGRANVLRARAGLIRRRLNAVQVVAGDDADAASADGAERIARFRLLSDRVVLATSSGRLLAVDLATGKPAWQARPGDQAGAHLVSNDDFVVVTGPDTGVAGDLYVFDAVTGRSVLHQQYDANQGPGAGGLVNLALSPDGVLVTMFNSRLVSRDLYDPGSGETKQDVTGRSNGGELPFMTSAADGNLVVTDDRVLAVYHGAGGQPSVKAYDLRTLRPLTFHDEDRGVDIEVGFAPGGNDPQATLSVSASGPSVYVVGQKSLAAYDLDRRGDSWTPVLGTHDRGLTRDFAVTQGFAVQINQLSVNPNAEKVPALQLWIYSRAHARSGAESGLLEQQPVLRDPAGFLSGQWQVTDGAFFYVSGDQRLKVRRTNP